MRYFTTYFDKNYLSRGLVLYESIKEHCEHFTVYILCLDKFTFDFFQSRSGSFPQINLLLLSDLEQADDELESCKSNRSKIEYYFTLSPCLPLYILQKYKLPHICSLDADILFLHSPESLFHYLNDYSIVITPHKFSNEIADNIIFGIYNVSFQVFKNDEAGLQCLQRWRTECINWCGDHYDEAGDRFADQKYLDNWTELYPHKVKVLDDDVSGIAPWNLNRFKITVSKNKFSSNNKRIIFYHFHYFKFFNKNWASAGFNEYRVRYNYAIGKLYLLYWNKVHSYNLFTAVPVSKSTRYQYPDNPWERIVKENIAFFKVMNKHLFALNVAKLSDKMKRILIRINA